MGIWRGTVLDWPGSVFMVGEPPKPGFGGCWVQPGQGMAELEAMFGLPEGGHPGIWFRARRARPGVWRERLMEGFSGHLKTIVCSPMAACMTAQTPA